MSSKKTKWGRNCPKCKRKLYYTSKQTLTNANKRESICSSCSNKGENNPFYGKKHTDEHKKYMSSIQNTQKYIEARKKISKKLKGRVITEEHKQKISKALIKYHKDNDSGMLGNTHSTEVKLLLSKLAKQQWTTYKETDEYKEWKNRKDEYELYRLEVDRITKANDLSKLPNYCKKNLYHRYELDHIYPIIKGFKNNIPAELIGHIDNLRIIPMSENRRKSDKIIEEIIPDVITEYIEEYE